MDSDLPERPSRPIFGIRPDVLLRESLKSDEISGPARPERIRELLAWFSRYADGYANGKWLRGHAFELAYVLATPEQFQGHDKIVQLCAMPAEEGGLPILHALMASGKVMRHKPRVEIIKIAGEDHRIVHDEWVIIQPPTP